MRWTFCNRCACDVCMHHGMHCGGMFWRSIFSILPSFFTSFLPPHSDSNGERTNAAVIYAATFLTVRHKESLLLWRLSVNFHHLRVIQLTGYVALLWTSVYELRCKFYYWGSIVKLSFLASEMLWSDTAAMNSNADIAGQVISFSVFYFPASTLGSTGISSLFMFIFK